MFVIQHQALWFMQQQCGCPVLPVLCKKASSLESHSLAMQFHGFLPTRAFVAFNEDNMKCCDWLSLLSASWHCEWGFSCCFQRCYRNSGHKFFYYDLAWNFWQIIIYLSTPIVVSCWSQWLVMCHSSASLLFSKVTVWHLWVSLEKATIALIVMLLSNLSLWRFCCNFKDVSWIDQCLIATCDLGFFSNQGYSGNWSLSSGSNQVRNSDAASISLYCSWCWISIMDRIMFCDQLCMVMYMMLIFVWDDGFVEWI
jgi:hypothetical protein